MSVCYIMLYGCWTENYSSVGCLIFCICFEYVIIPLLYVYDMGNLLKSHINEYL